MFNFEKSLGVTLLVFGLAHIGYSFNVKQFSTICAEQKGIKIIHENENNRYYECSDKGLILRTCAESETFDILTKSCVVNNEPNKIIIKKADTAELEQEELKGEEELESEEELDSEEESDSGEELNSDFDLIRAKETETNNEKARKLNPRATQSFDPKVRRPRQERNFQVPPLRPRNVEYFRFPSRELTEVNVPVVNDANLNPTQQFNVEREPLRLRSIPNSDERIQSRKERIREKISDELEKSRSHTKEKSNIKRQLLKLDKDLIRARGEKRFQLKAERISDFRDHVRPLPRRILKRVSELRKSDKSGEPFRSNARENFRQSSESSGQRPGIHPDSPIKTVKIREIRRPHKFEEHFPSNARSTLRQRRKIQEQRSHTRPTSPLNSNRARESRRSDNFEEHSRSHSGPSFRESGKISRQKAHIRSNLRINSNRDRETRKSDNFEEHLRSHSRPTIRESDEISRQRVHIRPLSPIDIGKGNEVRESEQFEKPLQSDDKSSFKDVLNSEVKLHIRPISTSRLGRRFEAQESARFEKRSFPGRK